MNRLNGKYILITGASQGLGRQLAIDFAREGHLDLLTAFLPAEKIREAYEEAITRNYLWHEFGDLNLIV